MAPSVGKKRKQSAAEEENEERNRKRVRKVESTPKKGRNLKGKSSSLLNSRLCATTKTVLSDRKNVRRSSESSTGPRLRRMASLNAQAKMHALYDSDGRSSFEEIAASAAAAAADTKRKCTAKPPTKKKKKSGGGARGETSVVTSPRRMASLNAQAILAASYSTDRPKITPPTNATPTKLPPPVKVPPPKKMEEVGGMKRKDSCLDKVRTQLKVRRFEDSMDLEKTLDLAKMVISGDSSDKAVKDNNNVRRDKIEDKAEVTITGMYINPVTNTSQSFCFSRVQTYKQATSTTFTPPPSAQPPPATQPLRPPPAHHPPPPPPPPAPHCHFTHYPPSPPTSSLPLDLALARHYNGAFALPHYAHNAATPTHYVRHPTGNYQTYAAAVDSCLIHKPVPFHPFQNNQSSRHPSTPPQHRTFQPRHPNNVSYHKQQQRPLAQPNLTNQVVRRASSSGTNKALYYGPAGTARGSEGGVGDCHLCVHFTASTSSSSSVVHNLCPSHWKSHRAVRGRPQQSSVITYNRPPPTKPDVGGRLSTLPTQTKTLTTIYPPKKVKMEVDDIFMDIETVPMLSKRCNSESPPVGNHPMATRRLKVNAADDKAMTSRNRGGEVGGVVKRGGTVTLSAEEFFKKVASGASWASSAQRQKEMAALRRAFNPTVTVPCLPMAAQLKKIASNRGNHLNGMKNSFHPPLVQSNKNASAASAAQPKSSSSTVPNASSSSTTTSRGRTVTSNGLCASAVTKPNEQVLTSPTILRNRAIKNVTRYSNGWTWEGAAFQQDIYIKNDDPPVRRRCFPAMRHIEGDIIRIRDCVLLKSGPRKNDLPYVAKVAALWENPEDGEMMFSLLWYYRPEHTELGRKPHHMEDEIFASKHRDVNSVACIEDKCFVLTLNEYCRYRRRGRMLEQSVVPTSSVVAAAAGGYARRDRMPPGRVSPDMVFFCRKVYDFRQKRILKNPT